MVAGSSCSGLRTTSTAAQAYAALPPAAPVKQLDPALEQAARRGAVGVHVEVAAERQPRDEHRLVLGELADPAGAVAVAEPGRLRAAHREVEREGVEQRVVDAHRARLEPPSELLAAVAVAGVDGRAEA